MVLPWTSCHAHLPVFLCLTMNRTHRYVYNSTGLQIKVHNSKLLFFLFHNPNICCGHPEHMFKLMDKKIITILTPSLPYISARNILGGNITILILYGVTYNFIQNHNHCRDLHHIFSCSFETFGTMSEI